MKTNPNEYKSLEEMKTALIVKLTLHIGAIRTKASRKDLEKSIESVISKIEDAKIAELNKESK